MPVRFVLGRAGSGKTVHCLNAVREALRGSPLNGPRLVLLVPEQVSLHMERSLLDGLTAAAAHRAEVLSFRRLAYRIIASYGDGGRTSVSTAARAMLLRLLLVRHGPQLRYYRRSERYPGVVDTLARTITEFIEEAVTPDDLDLPTDDDHPARSLKLHDLRLIYAAYLDALGDDALDPSQQLDIARSRIARCGWADDAHVWVDGFAGFSMQERLTLVEIAARAARVHITLLIDPDNAPPPGAADPFAKTRRTLSELTHLFTERGVAVEPPHTFRGPPRRFANAPALARIERHLFSGTAPSQPIRTDGLEIVELPDRRTEVDWAAAEILGRVRRPTSPLRFRDIAVIARDLDDYHATIEAAFRARGIPFFLDRRRSIAHHPLVELLRGLLALAADDYPVDVVRALLKTGLLTLVDDQADALENHLVATALAGHERWTARAWPLPPRERADPPAHAVAAIDRVNTARARFLADVDPWVLRTRASTPATGPVWYEHLQDVLHHLSVGERIEQWACQSEQDGELDQAEAHRQVLRDVAALLDDLRTVFADTPMTLRELSATVESALGQLTLGLAPPMLDQVLVGTIERSRQPDLKTAIVLGVTDGAFPTRQSEDPVLNDDDRDWLESRDLRLGTPRRQRTLDESMLFYIAVTRASESLLITYPAADENGKELRPSPYLADLKTAWAGIPVRRIGDPLRAREDWSVLSVNDLASQFAYEFRHRPNSSEDDDHRSHWNDLYNLARTDEELAPAVVPALRGLVYTNAASLAAASAETDISEPFKASVSQLETYATCAFKHFAQYRLRLAERAEARLAERDVGTIHHAILEKFIQSIVEQGLSLTDLDQSEIRAGLDFGSRRAAESLPLMDELSSARERYLAARCQRDLRRVLAAQKRVAGAGKFRPARTEQEFGRGDGGLPPLELRTPRGRTVHLRGFIDRVDLAEWSDELLGVVIDYKTTRGKRLDLSGVYHGLSLQLLGYLLVLARQGRTLAGRSIIPAGAFYVGLSDNYRSVKHPSEADEGENENSPFRPRGVFDLTRADALEPVSTGKAQHYALYRKTDGALGYVDSSDAAAADDFSNLLRRTEEQLGEWADRILDGRIDVAPYRLKSLSPCSWCVFDGVCRFETDYSRTRFLENLKRSEVFRRLAGTDHGATDA